MNIRQKLLLGSVLFSSLAAGLYLLPRSVVSRQAEAVRDGAEGKEKTNPADANASAGSPHQLSPEMEKELNQIRISLSKAGESKEKSRICTSLADAFIRANQFDSAGFWYESAMKLQPDKSMAYEAGSAYFNGLAFISTPSALESASEKVRKLLESVPPSDSRYPEAMAKSSLTWVNSASPMKGILKLRELAESYPQNSFIAFQLGMLSYQSNQYDKAVSRFQKVVSLEDSNQTAWFYLANCLLQTGKKEEAMKAAQSGLKRAKDEQTKASFEELIQKAKN